MYKKVLVWQCKECKQSSSSLSDAINADLQVLIGGPIPAAFVIEHREKIAVMLKQLIEEENQEKGEK